MPANTKQAESPQQTAIMERLSQQSAAWLVGINARTLRDYPDIRRGADGSYDARDVVAWAARRIPHPDFDDEQIERLKVASDFLYGKGKDDLSLLSVLDELRTVQAKYGDAGLAEFVKLLLVEWSLNVEPYRKRAMAGDDGEGLKIAVVCEKCGKLRKGRRWIVAAPPAGYRKQHGFCPDHSSVKGGY